MNQVMEKNNKAVEQREELMRRVKKLEDMVVELSARMPQDSHRHLSEMQKAVETFRCVADESCQQLEAAANEAGKRIAPSVQILKLDEFKYFTVESAKSIRETARLSVARIRRVAKWRRWEQFGVALLIVMLLVLILR